MGRLVGNAGWGVDYLPRSVMRWLGVVLLFACGAAYSSEGDGSKYQGTSSLAYFGGAGAVCDNEAALISASGPYNFTGVNVAGGPDSGNCNGNYVLKSDGTVVVPNAAFSGWSRFDCVAPEDMEPGGPCAPEEPDECNCIPELGCPETFVASYVEGPRQYCNAVSRCLMKIVSSTATTMTIQHTAQNCGPEDPDNGEDPDDPENPPDEPPDGPGTGAEGCEPVGDGEYCASATGDGQCGYMNDEYVCLGQVKPDECKVLSGGARVCGPAASTTPPVPDNGTPGQPATPDGQVSQTTGSPGTTITNIYNYYDSSTVGGSGRDPGSTGAGSNSSGIGGSEGNGPGEGEIGNALGNTAKVIPETQYDMSDSLDEGLLSWGSDECPEPPSVTFFGHSVTYDAITWLCALAEMLSGLVMAMAYLGALAIMFKGN